MYGLRGGVERYFGGNWPERSRAVTGVQIGAYKWRKGVNSIKTGSKWAQNTCLCTPNVVGSLLEKQISEPFFTPFCSLNGPFSRHIGIFAWAKTGPNGLKVGYKQLYKHAKWSRISLGQNAFLTHF